MRQPCSVRPVIMCRVEVRDGRLSPDTSLSLKARFFPDPCPSLYYYQPYPETKLKDTLTRDKKVLQMGLSPTQKW